LAGVSSKPLAEQRSEKQKKKTPTVETKKRRIKGSENGKKEDRVFDTGEH
jgi:hypothetical protein